MAKILIIDDNIDMLDTLEHLFNFYDHDVAKAENGKVGVQAAANELPDLIILDALMPVMNGFEACRQLRLNSATRLIPIIFLSANYTAPEHRRRGLELGADEYLLKPFNAKELIARVNALLNRTRYLQKLKTDNNTMLRRDVGYFPHLPETAQREEHPAFDKLTGLYNRFAFEDRLDTELQQESEAESDLSLLLVDVDAFEKVNAAYGMHTGDYVLMKIANVILTHTRSTDLVFRMTQNKFAVILPQTNETSAFYEAEKIRSAIEQTDFFDDEFFEQDRNAAKRRQVSRNVTVSIGATHCQREDDWSDHLRSVEKALARAKTKGKNLTVRFSELLTEA